MSRHFEGFQMYETRTSEEARRRNRYATNKMNNELGTQKELERLHLETMKKERRRLETELSKIRNKGQYMVKRPTNVSNQAVNFTLRQAGPLYGSKSNPGMGSAWHPATGNTNNGVKRRTTRERDAEKDSPRGRLPKEKIESQKQVGNATTSQQPEEVNKSEPNETTNVSEEIKPKPLKEQVTVENGIRRKSVTTVTKSGAIVEVISSQGAMAGNPTPSPRRNNKKTKDTISNMNMDEARESVAKRLLSQDQDKTASRSTRRSPSLTTVAEEQPKPVAVPSLSKAPLSSGEGSKSGSASSKKKKVPTATLR